MRRILITVTLLGISGLIFSQVDPGAIKTLDEFSAAAQSAPSVAIKFRLVNKDEQNEKSDTATGYLLMSKDRYRLEMPDNITWFNGSVSWDYLRKEKEVTITRPGKKDDSFMSRPSSIFTVYKKGYKIRMLEINDRDCVIDLYPEDIKSDLVRIRMAVNKTSYALSGAEYRRKDGTSLILLVDDYSLKKVPDAGDFVFDRNRYRDAEINDMR